MDGLGRIRDTEGRPGTNSGADGDVTRLRLDSIEPDAKSGEAAEIESPFFGDMGVPIERDVRERVGLPREEGVLLEMTLHHVERQVALLLSLGELGRIDGLAPVAKHVACARDVRLVLV